MPSVRARSRTRKAWMQILCQSSTSWHRFGLAVSLRCASFSLRRGLQRPAFNGLHNDSVTNRVYFEKMEDVLKRLPEKAVPTRLAPGETDSVAVSRGGSLPF